MVYGVGDCSFWLTGMVALWHKIGWRVLEKMPLKDDGDGLGACGGVQFGEDRVDVYPHPAGL